MERSTGIELQCLVCGVTIRLGEPDGEGRGRFRAHFEDAHQTIGVEASQAQRV